MLIHVPNNLPNWQILNDNNHMAIPRCRWDRFVVHWVYVVVLVLHADDEDDVQLVYLVVVASLNQVCQEDHDTETVVAAYLDGQDIAVLVVEVELQDDHVQGIADQDDDQHEVDIHMDLVEELHIAVQDDEVDIHVDLKVVDRVLQDDAHDVHEKVHVDDARAYQVAYHMA